uniref:Gamma-glutamylcyclotransferase a n=1 Tax=Takifugu rubripes TaxID=31033 RepID=A0A3B5KJX6_TAKRU
PACTVYTFKIALIYFSTKSRTNKRNHRYIPPALVFRFLNLLKERLELANPSASFVTTGRLKVIFSSEHMWHGGVATIEFHPGAEVWGVIWTLSNENLTSLDNQEGVDRGLYSPLEVSVETDKGIIVCRTYQINNFHACLPSPDYKMVVCMGAEQNGLPTEYLRKLKAIQTNNYSGPSILDQLKTKKQLQPLRCNPASTV